MVGPSSTLTSLSRVAQSLCASIKSHSNLLSFKRDLLSLLFVLKWKKKKKNSLEEEIGSGNLSGSGVAKALEM